MVYKFLNLAAASLALLVAMPFSAMAQQQLNLGVNRELQSAICAPVPLSIIDGGVEIFEEETYLVVSLSEPQGRTNFIDVVALDSTATPAYAESVDCSLSNGSFRTLHNCTTVVTNVIFERDALVLKCLKYASNSVDGNTVVSTTNQYTGTFCECDCDGNIFAAIQASDGTCPCACSGSTGTCTCYAPFQETLATNWNTRYKATTDALGANVTITNVYDVEILNNCGTPNITYNTSSVCVPPKFLPTPAPTTRQPTAKPTRKPTARPTRKPTRRPTARPTRKPTRKPTKKPTHRPTSHPTVTPTICSYICEKDWWEDMCHYLKLYNLCDELSNVNGGPYTIFAPTDRGFKKFQSPVTEYVIKSHLVGTATRINVDELVCGGTLAMASGATTTTNCVNREARSALKVEPEITEKFQLGKLDLSKLQEYWPEVYDAFYPVTNGIILELDRVMDVGPPPSTPAPISPTRAPVSPTPAPVSKTSEQPEPTGRPTPKVCEDRPDFAFRNDPAQNCDWVALKKPHRCAHRYWQRTVLHHWCPKTCGGDCELD